ncbi:MAG: hypothetical protein MI725_10870 [Pirellulales bacterium]|nr:hypothetical protein [Pirellulales bacterium]
MRHESLKKSELALSDTRWRLTYDVNFETNLNVENQNSEAVVSIGRPYSTPFTEILDEEQVNHDSSLRVEPREKNWDFRVSTLHADSYTVTAKFDLQVHSDRMWSQYTALESLKAVKKDQYTQSEEAFPTQSPRIGEVLKNKDAPPSDATDSEKIQYFFEFCMNDLIPATAEDEGDNVPWTLAFMRATPLGRAKVFVTLCRAVGIPARLVTGFELRHNNQAQTHVWAEVHRENRWVPFDPTTGHGHDAVLERFVPVRRGSDKVLRTKNAKIVRADFSMARLAPDEEVLKAEKQQPTQIFDLTRLPLEMHELISLMLLLPFGALITAVFRNIVGLHTLGTFAPALLAMSFIYAAWGTGLVILLVVIIAGLVGRSFLERLHLLMVPRLSIVLTLTIMCVAFGVSLLNYFLPSESVHAVLLPMVILTILIERFFVTMEEDGAGYALRLVLGTVVVAAFCYLLLRWDYVGQQILIYPELHFFTVAAFILIGRYSGYRLTELWRFRDLAQEKT